MQLSVLADLLAVGSGWVFVNNEDCRRWEFMSQPTLFSLEVHVGIESLPGLESAGQWRAITNVVVSSC